MSTDALNAAREECNKLQAILSAKPEEQDEVTKESLKTQQALVKDLEQKVAKEEAESNPTPTEATAETTSSDTGTEATATEETPTTGDNPEN